MEQAVGLSKKKIFLLGLMLAFLAYGAGAATVKYNLFPYPRIKLMIRGGNPLPKALLQGQPLVAALKKGGYTIFFRHARKRNGQPSPLNFNLFAQDRYRCRLRLSSPSHADDNAGGAQGWAIW